MNMHSYPHQMCDPSLLSHPLFSHDPFSVILSIIHSLSFLYLSFILSSFFLSSVVSPCSFLSLIHSFSHPFSLTFRSSIPHLINFFSPFLSLILSSTHPFSISFSLPCFLSLILSPSYPYSHPLSHAFPLSSFLSSISLFPHPFLSLSLILFSFSFSLPPPLLPQVSFWCKRCTTTVTQ